MDMVNFFEALKLMAIGLATVFCVLLIIIALGNALIKLINKYAPEEEVKKADAQASSAVDPNVAQAINAAIMTITNGKMKADKISKM